MQIPPEVIAAICYKPQTKTGQEQTMNAQTDIKTAIKAEIDPVAKEVGESLRALEALLETPAQKRAAKVLHTKLERGAKRLGKHVGLSDEEVTTMGGGGTNKEK